MEGNSARDASRASTSPKAFTAAQKQLVKRQQELEHWKIHSKQLRSRNLITGLAIGAFVLSCYGLNNGISPLVSYTILSVKQEKIMDEIDDEAKVFIMKGPRTGANS
ncbi:cytochrome c oxidase assembly factor 3 homolog, mitochondrial-like [Myxocyprinus asiaticus]|uniref:cytochrome c oxidase assembly factor 3 homolog, mitochondrial-like n=1 Tax=Myxocyprinus asiaticus TaxID=70543 RepID=UPI0022233008|nr:cytochrome c oxidase assembly factor 3 homolog, mitochondrial-like [Myxocyprinus asiaticus]